MAHFAKIENNIVTDVIIVLDNVVGQYPESDEVGKLFIASIGVTGNWLQTSLDGGFRKQHAHIGGTYDAQKNQFVEPKPFASWSLDSNNDWQPPTPKPEGNYFWNESTLSWVAYLVG